MDSKDVKQVRDVVIAGSAVVLAVASLVATTSILLRSNGTLSTSSPINIYNGTTLPAADDSTDSSDSPSQEPESKTAKTDSAEPPQRWKRVQQYWSESLYDWKDKEVKKLTPEEEEEAKKLLFTVKVRVHDPKDDEQTSTTIEDIMPPLREVLKEVLTEVDNVHDEESGITANHVFRHWDELKEVLERKRKELSMADSKIASSNSIDASVQTDSATEEAAVASLLSADITSSPTPVKRRRRTKTYTKDELTDQIEHLETLLKFVDVQYSPVQKKLDRMLPKGVITYSLLFAIFRAGREVVTRDEDSGEMRAFTQRAMEYTNHPIKGKSFKISGQFVEWQGKKYVRSYMEADIKYFAGMRRIEGLAVRPMVPEVRQTLSKRGTMYKQYTGQHYVEYTGSELICVSYNMMGNKEIDKSPVGGRVMIDREGYAKSQPSAYGNSSLNADGNGCQCDDCMRSISVDLVEEKDEDEDENEGEIVIDHDTSSDIKDADLCLLPPTVFAFSFALRKWGQCTIGFKPIEYDEEAFEHLVLEGQHKLVIRSLVESTQQKHYDTKKLVGDVITGKGGGCIIVVHGRPGTGKTLTAEAVSEHLKRPLLMISSGQLGIDPKVLEDKLRETLALAEKWHAILLIDEADVFLSARQPGDLMRNGLVAVFLRMLEYFQGILFLTTNRVESFDEAFVSRFSLAIKYSELDRPARKIIWEKFLRLASVGVAVTTKRKSHTNGANGQNGDANGIESPPSEFDSTISEKDLEFLTSHEINGRVIKQVIRASQSIALAANESLSIKHLKMMLSYQKSFSEDFKLSEIDYSAPDAKYNDRINLYH